MRTHNFPSPTGYSGRTITKAPEWHDLVVLDVLFNNLATGLFLVAAICHLAKPSVFEACALWAYPISLALLLTDFALLVLDLGDPLRFHHMLRVFKPGSPMSLGTWCLTAFSLVLAVIVLVEFVVLVGWWSWDDWPARWSCRIAAGVGLPFAFGSAAYKGVLFSTTAQPGWRDARWLGAYLMNSALVLGASELIVIAAILDESRAVKLLATADVLLMILYLMWFAGLARELQPALSQTSFHVILYPTALVLVLTHTVFPVIVLSVSRGVLSTSCVLGCLVLSHLLVRYILVHLPHRIQHR
jgi:hypothetical protein